MDGLPIRRYFNFKKRNMHFRNKILFFTRRKDVYIYMIILFDRISLQVDASDRRSDLVKLE